MEELMNEWAVADTDGKLITFEEFLSVLAYSLRRDLIDRDVEAAFRRFAHANSSNDDIIHAEDVQQVVLQVTGVYCTLEEAQEMCWEADLEERGFVDVHAFVAMLSTVEPGWLIHFNWHKNLAQRFLHDLVKDGEFDEELDQDDDYADDDTDAGSVANLSVAVLDGSGEGKLFASSASAPHDDGYENKLRDSPVATAGNDDDDGDDGDDNIHLFFSPSGTPPPALPPASPKLFVNSEAHTPVLASSLAAPDVADMVHIGNAATTSSSSATTTTTSTARFAALAASPPEPSNAPQQPTLFAVNMHSDDDNDVLFEL
jgi:hypothetical protein